jgi:hypothetical protein
MKNLITILLVLAAVIVFSLNNKSVRAQENILERKIRLEMDQEPLHKAFMHLNQITDYKFSYNSDLVDDDKLISLSFKDIPLNNVLDSLFRDTTLVYDLVGQHIVIHKKEVVSFPNDTTKKEKPVVSNSQPLFKQMDVTRSDTNYTHKWEEDSEKWVLFSREIKYYRDSAQLAGTLNERWNSQNNTWENYDRTIKQYDVHGNMMENLQQQWSAAQEKWINLKLKTFSYDRYGNKSEVLYHEWQQAAGQWYSTVRYLIDYNLFGEEKEVLIKVYSPATDKWSNDTRYTFIYDDGTGPPDETLVESWNSFTETWDNRGKYYMQYNLRGNKVRETRSTWNQNMNRWMNGLRFLMDYDNRKLTSEIEQRWDYRDREWNNAIRNIFSYDEQGEVRQMVQERWNRDSSKWETKNIFLHSNIKDIQNPETSEKTSDKEK